MANRASLYNWADERLDGTLAERLAAWRAEPLTIDEIVDELRNAHDLVISRETVRRWIKEAVPA